jgi:phage-related tail protein
MQFLNIILEFGMNQKKMSKKEDRIKRQNEKKLKDQQKKVRLAKNVEVSSKLIRVTEKPDLTKIPRSVDADNYKNHYFSWCVTKADLEGVWSWGEARRWEEEEYLNTIEPHFQALDNNSWQEVETQTYNGASNQRKNLNKYQRLNSICEEAQQRWQDIEIISQFEVLFRLRLGTSRRIWGVRVQHHFFIVWYERHHQIYPLERD